MLNLIKLIVHYQIFKRDFSRIHRRSLQLVTQCNATVTLMCKHHKYGTHFIVPLFINYVLKLTIVLLFF